MAFVALLKANSTKSKKNTFMLVTHAKYTVVTRHGVFYCSSELEPRLLQCN